MKPLIQVLSKIGKVRFSIFSAYALQIRGRRLASYEMHVAPARVDSVDEEKASRDACHERADEQPAEDPTCALDVDHWLGAAGGLGMPTGRRSSLNRHRIAPSIGRTHRAERQAAP